MVKHHKMVFLAVFLASFSMWAEEAQVIKEPLPIGMDFYLSQSVGAKAPFKSEQAPYVITHLYAYPYYKTKPFWGERRIKTFVEFYTSFEWLAESNPLVSHVGKKFDFGDIKFRTELQNALKFSDIGLSISPAFEIETPVSTTARKSNRIAGLGGYINVNWSKWGFFIFYKPVAVGYVHSENYKSWDCDKNSTSADNLGGNICKIAGRQTMLQLKNGVYVGYNYKEHTITAGMRVNHAILRAPGQGEKPSASQGDIMESSVAMLEYGYTLPTKNPLSLMAGVFSSQDYYPAKNGFRMPFFNFTEPAKNETEVYLAMTLSI